MVYGKLLTLEIFKGRLTAALVTIDTVRRSPNFKLKYKFEAIFFVQYEYSPESYFKTHCIKLFNKFTKHILSFYSDSNEKKQWGDIVN